MKVHSCNLTKPHTFHSFRAIVPTRCDGKTACGEKTHKAHNFPQEQALWCFGLCGCRDYTLGRHKPGAHK